MAICQGNIENIGQVAKLARMYGSARKACQRTSPRPVYDFRLSEDRWIIYEYAVFYLCTRSWANIQLVISFVTTVQRQKFFIAVTN